MSKKTLLDVIKPESNTTILIYDVHASESGALAILDDLYQQILDYSDKSIQWIFAVSIPEYQEQKNIKVLRYPWVKKNWGNRLYFDSITTRKILKEYKPDKVFSLQNEGIDYFKGEQYVYLHLPFVLSEHRFTIQDDGKKLWLYQNVLSKKIFASLRRVNKTIVQTKWMKQALMEKAHILPENIEILQPDITVNSIGVFVDSEKSRSCFFYPATAFNYKNHMTLLKAINSVQEQGFKEYEVFLTIKPHENKYTEKLYEYVQENELNVIFNGPISRKEVFERYTKSVLLFPSYVESFGLPLLEARLTGSPIIAADTSFSREILEGYDKVQYFEEMDSIEMSKCIIKVLKNI